MVKGKSDKGFLHYHLKFSITGVETRADYHRAPAHESNLLSKKQKSLLVSVDQGLSANTLPAQEQISGVIHLHHLDLFVGHALLLKSGENLFGDKVDPPICQCLKNWLWSFDLSA